MAEHLTSEDLAVAEKVRRRLYGRGRRPRTVLTTLPPEEFGKNLTSRHPIEDDGWITVLPRPWDAARRKGGGRHG